MKMRYVFTAFLMVVLCAGTVFAGCTKKPGDNPGNAQEAGGSAQVAGEARQYAGGTQKTNPGAKEDNMEKQGIWEADFNFERRSDGELLHAEVADVADDGAKVTITKRIGRPNYRDTKNAEKTYHISREQYEQLADILHRYPLQEICEGRKTSSYGGNVCRTLRVCDGDKVYFINDFIVFPESLPPVKELMYTDLYNFFNDIAAKDAEMAAVKTDPLPDPRKNPIYYDRVVEQFGKKVHLVPGTGYDDNRSAEIAYGDKKWWIEEGYVGRYVMTDRDKKLANGPEITEESASFEIKDDGSFELVMNGARFAGTFGNKRFYKDPPGGVYEPVDPDNGERQGFSFDYNGYPGMFEDDEAIEDSELTPVKKLAALQRHIYVECHGEPHPHVVEPRYMEMTRVSAMPDH